MKGRAMLVFVKLSQPIADRTHTYSHIECDVPGCGMRSPPSSELMASGKSLTELGWYLAGGVHRCPEHYDRDDVPGNGPVYRDE
jgi:hypothetical protein